jgi:hypothetical protein
MLDKDSQPAECHIRPGELWWLFPVGEDGMEKFNIYAFYCMGAAVARGRDLLKFPISFNQTYLPLSEMKAWFEIFLERTSPESFKSARSNAERILVLLNQQLEGKAIGNIGLDVSLPFEFVRDLSKQLVVFEARFSGESEHSNIFSLPDIGIYAIHKLLDQSETNLPPDVRARLSSEALADIRAAGKCLALGCHTASGLHILRAVEALITAYVVKVTQKQINRKDRNWGAYIRVLKALGADANVLGYLYHIKEFYRNPLMHPEQSLDADEALSLFNSCMSAIVQLDAAIVAWP